MPTIQSNIVKLYAFSFLQMTLFPMAIITLFWKDQVGLTLTEILTEKEELPPPAQALQTAIRSSPPPQERIDLHGCTGSEAEIKTENFLARARRNRLQTVLVITGKGLHSPEGPVLKDVIEARLKIMKSNGTILAYLWEKKDREKSGALLVYLP